MCQVTEFRAAQPCLLRVRDTLIPGNGQFLARAGFRKWPFRVESSNKYLKTLQNDSVLLETCRH